eukprot:CAMPEP_0201643948 /NCGR_PEP_ID=MMETSP0493-20130528/29193_1 /ASSEMBLY_ACC=CAM_ASM_000838 /TAXON_ID=420259 /ORGANISM="Thalassiosira gravida, Strain GMp14c1" /LENGTH=491 /DNA_ID=CAMNT_0048118503 /DNA_START=163 /DNA_END=1635 /DNA_ORIENTATION=+
MLHLLLLLNYYSPLLVALAFLVVTPSPSLGFSPDAPAIRQPAIRSNDDTFVILGGTGRIGTAVASHLLLRAPKSRIILVGRDDERGTRAVSEVLGENPSVGDDGDDGDDSDNVSFRKADWRNDDELRSVIGGCTCLIHTAGPFLEEKPTPLRAAIDSGCRAYVDVSDPLDYLELSLAMSRDAEESGLTAVLAAGAFPGMSNVMAVEAASLCRENGGEGAGVRDTRFNYFTAGLGGSGDVNLYITNLGFGEPMAQYQGGGLRLYEALSGLLLGKISFYLSDAEWTQKSPVGFGNDEARARVGEQTVFAWPFPEAATVPAELGASGESSAAMGTAPDVWNDMLGILVALVPRKLWRSKRFSQFLADFSQPLVKATDFLLKLTSPGEVGETHAMRVDVTGTDGSAVSVVQAHESFRRCVGQSCAEFALDLLEHPSPGVQLPEQRYRNDDARRRIIKQLTSTPGTFAYTGPVAVSSAAPPSKLDQALLKANEAEI